MHITLITLSKLHGSKPLRIGGIVKLVKEPENMIDSESIACEMKDFGKIGYVANDASKVIRGSMSAGRVYDKINNEWFARIKFIKDSIAIAKLFTQEEYDNEIRNHKSDINYLTKNDFKKNKPKKTKFSN